MGIIRRHTCRYWYICFANISISSRKMLEDNAGASLMHWSITGILGNIRRSAFHLGVPDAISKILRRFGETRFSITWRHTWPIGTYPIDYAIPTALLLLRQVWLQEHSSPVKNGGLLLFPADKGISFERSVMDRPHHKIQLFLYKLWCWFMTLF